MRIMQGQKQLAFGELDQILALSSVLLHTRGKASALVPHLMSEVKVTTHERDVREILSNVLEVMHSGECFTVVGYIQEGDVTTGSGK